MKKNNAMMKLAGIIGIICATVFVSCTKEEAGIPETKEKGREATITIAPPEGGMATRVVTSDDGTHLKIDGWKLGDELNLYKMTIAPEGWIDSLYPAITFTCIDAKKGTFSGLLPEWVASVDELNIATTGTVIKYDTNIIIFHPKATASTNVEDVILLANVRSGKDPFQMKAFGSILKVKNESHKDVECAFKGKGNDNIRNEYVREDLMYLLGKNQYFNYFQEIAFKDIKFTITKDTSTFVYILGTKNGIGICVESDGLKTTTCSVVPFKNNVEEGKLYSYTPAIYVEGDYLGFGTKIDDVIWAPVNCGYDATNYKWGKLYQFGRAVGGGYNDGSTFTEGVYQIAETTATVSSTANTNPADNVFYKGTDGSGYDWYITTGTRLSSWPMDSSHSQYVAGKIANPCPEGWRVPTQSEQTALMGSHTGGDLQDGSGIYSGMKGKYFDGSTAAAPTSGVFLPAAGYRGDASGSASNRGDYGIYWSSSVNNKNAWYLGFYSGYAGMLSYNRAFGYSVRCVKYIPQVVFDGGTIKDMEKTDLVVLDW